jgi:hypothetical protein
MKKPAFLLLLFRSVILDGCRQRHPLLPAAYKAVGIQVTSDFEQTARITCGQKYILFPKEDRDFTVHSNTWRLSEYEKKGMLCAFPIIDALKAKNR